MKTWHLFLWLVITATIYAYAGKLIVWLFIIYLAFRALRWVSIHRPGIFWFVVGFFQGLLGK